MRYRTAPHNCIIQQIRDDYSVINRFPDQGASSVRSRSLSSLPLEPIDRLQLSMAAKGLGNDLSEQVMQFSTKYQPEESYNGQTTAEDNPQERIPTA
jgi:hypothetical protein